MPGRASPHAEALKGHRISRTTTTGDNGLRHIRVHSPTQPQETSSCMVLANNTAGSGRSWGIRFLRFLRGREGTNGASYSKLAMSARKKFCRASLSPSQGAGKRGTKSGPLATGGNGFLQVESTR